MKHLLLFIFLLFIGMTLQAQLSVYDISNYKARYDRRPSFYIEPRFSYLGRISNTNTALNRLALTFPSQWRLGRNTDEKIVSWRFSSNLSAQFGLRPSTFSSDRFNAYSSEFSIARDVSHYYQPDKFWGWSGGIVTDATYHSTDNGTKMLDLGNSLGFFHGHGRIEYAEDALLANWIMEDLKEAGSITQYSPEETEMLARTITDIIGNRTFDLRRRRIYELKQLKQTLFDAGLVDQESFDLFAILNDNWAFANRAFLRHGKRLTYGVSGNTEYLDNEFISNNLRRSFNAEGNVFIRYEKNKIVNNNGSLGWSLGANISHVYTEDDFSNIEGIIKNNRWLSDLNLGYNYVWLPTSRTEFKIIGTAGWFHVFPDELEKESDFFTTDSIRLSSSFIGDFFISYRWSLSARAQLLGVYQIRNSDSNISFAPSFSLTSHVYLF